MVSLIVHEGFAKPMICLRFPPNNQSGVSSMKRLLGSFLGIALLLPGLVSSLDRLEPAPPRPI